MNRPSSVGRLLLISLLLTAGIIATGGWLLVRERNLGQDAWRRAVQLQEELPTALTGWERAAPPPLAPRLPPPRTNPPTPTRPPGPTCRAEQHRLAAERLVRVVLQASNRAGGWGQLPAYPKLTALLLDELALLPEVERAAVVLTDRKVKRKEQWVAVARPVLRLERGTTGQLTARREPPPLREAPGTEGGVFEFPAGPVARVLIWGKPEGTAGTPPPEPPQPAEPLESAPDPPADPQPTADAPVPNLAEEVLRQTTPVRHWLTRTARRLDGAAVLPVPVLGLLLAGLILVALLLGRRGAEGRREEVVDRTGDPAGQSSSSVRPEPTEQPEEHATRPTPPERAAQPAARLGTEDGPLGSPPAWYPLRGRHEVQELELDGVALACRLHWVADRPPEAVLELAWPQADELLLLLVSLVTPSVAAPTATREITERLSGLFQVAAQGPELSSPRALGQFLELLDRQTAWATGWQVGVRGCLLRYRPRVSLLEVATLAAPYPWIRPATSTDPTAPPIPCLERLAGEVLTASSLVRAGYVPLLLGEQLHAADRFCNDGELAFLRQAAGEQTTPEAALGQPLAAVTLLVGCGNEEEEEGGGMRNEE